MAVHTLRVPVTFVGLATSTGEAVTFTGFGTLRTRVSRDTESGEQTLLADFDMRGIVGLALPSLTRYVLTHVEFMVLPHQPLQTLAITFPMEPSSGSLRRTLRTGVMKLIVLLDVNTGAALAINGTSVVLL